MIIYSENDEIFLKEFLKEFYRQIIKIENYANFENILKEWIKEFFDDNNKDLYYFLKIMEYHDENENWFSSLIGFFYEHGIGTNDNIINKDKSLELYLLSINNNNDNNNQKSFFSIYQLINIIISKFLLSFYYYKFIILDKRDYITNDFLCSDNVHVMSHNQFENFNNLLLMINLSKDELNAMENYFNSKDVNNEENQLNIIKKKELIELNNLD
ncbi:unnamed protein product [Rhizophagus irregularis]|nr:unnamed protein product [Rhizophagus irregularis]